MVRQVFFVLSGTYVDNGEQLGVRASAVFTPLALMHGVCSMNKSALS